MENTVYQEGLLNEPLPRISGGMRRQQQQQQVSTTLSLHALLQTSEPLQRRFCGPCRRSGMLPPSGQDPPGGEGEARPCVRVLLLSNPPGNKGDVLGSIQSEDLKSNCYDTFTKV